jgi:hypothetical protein
VGSTCRSLKFQIPLQVLRKLNDRTLAPSICSACYWCCTTVSLNECPKLRARVRHRAARNCRVKRRAKSIALVLYIDMNALVLKENNFLRISVCGDCIEIYARKSLCTCLQEGILLFSITFGSFPFEALYSINVTSLLLSTAAMMLYFGSTTSSTNW